MKTVELSALVKTLESGSRPSGGASIDACGVPSLGGEHLDNDGHFRLHNLKFIPFEYFAKLRSGRIVENDILIVKDGATTGKLSFVDSRFPFKEAAINEHLFRIAIDTENANARYVYHFLSSREGQKQVLSDFRGATVGGIGRSFIGRVQVPLPPLDEQRRIVAILDLADDLRRKRRLALEKLNALPQAIFQEMFGDPVGNPKGWPVCSLAEVGELERGVSKHRPRNDPAILNGPYPLIQTGDVANSDGYIRSHASSYSELGLRQSRLWPKGTLCITIAANIGKTGILQYDACFPDSVVGFTPGRSVTSDYVRIWMSLIEDKLESLAPKFAQKNINLAILRELQIPIPPIESQERFTSILVTLERLTTNGRAHLSNLDLLFDSLLHRAFSGTLAPLCVETIIAPV